MSIESILRSTVLHKPYLSFRDSRLANFLFTITHEKEWWVHLSDKTKDRASLVFKPALIPLHYKIWKHLGQQKINWIYYKYSSGYLYQGWDRLGLTGSRPTEKRFIDYGLNTILKPHMEVLDIGANVGFLALACAEKVAHVDAVEFNPFLVAIGEDAASFLGIKNISFYNQDFQKFEVKKQYDLIMSYANHNTVDGNMNPDIRGYFERMHNLLKPDGTLLFESHHHEPSDFHSFMDSLSDLFIREERKFFLSRSVDEGNRYFFRLRKLKEK